MIDPSTLPAPVLEWRKASHAIAPRATSSGSAVLDRARALAERLPPSVEGHGGDEALFKAACELATILGEDAAAIEGVLADVYNPRCAPSWDLGKLRREARRAAMRQATPEARYARRREARVTVPDPGAAAFHVPAPDVMPAAAMFVQTPRGDEQWHYDPRRENYRAFGDKGLIASLKLTGADAYVEVQDGAKVRTPRQIMNSIHVGQVEHVHIDFSCPRGGTYDPEYADGGGLMVEGVYCPTIAPVFDPAVDAWLQALAGRAHTALGVFVASCAQAHIHRPAVAVAITGPHSIGKSVFAKALARMWGATHPVTLRTVVEKFNASMTRCPIVLDDEGNALRARLVSTETFRELLQSEARDVEPKGLEKRTLRGCQRFLITGNDASVLVFTDSAGPQAIDALTQRLLYVRVPDEQGPHVTALLEQLHTAPDSGRVDMDRVCGHFAWIQANTPVGGGRFIGAALADASATAAALVANTLEAHSSVFERIRAVLEGDAPPNKAVFIASGAVWVRAGELLTALNANTTGERWELGRLRAALAPFRGPRGAVWRDGGTVRAWELDAARMIDALGVDESRALDALERHA